MDGDEARETRFDNWSEATPILQDNSLYLVIRNSPHFLHTSTSIADYISITSFEDRISCKESPP